VDRRRRRRLDVVDCELSLFAPSFRRTTSLRSLSSSECSEARCEFLVFLGDDFPLTLAYMFANWSSVEVDRAFFEDVPLRGLLRRDRDRDRLSLPSLPLDALRRALPRRIMPLLLPRALDLRSIPDALSLSPSEL